MPIKASDFTNLKARVKAECLRRNKTGSVAAYGGSSYDYTVVPAAGKRIAYEHYTKLADPLTAIDGVTRKPRTTIKQSDITAMTTKITQLEAIAVDSTSTGCSASCTGLCYSTCSGTCKGTCTNACGSACGNNCTSSCSAMCADDCYRTCYGDCDGGCEDACSGTCGQGCGGCSGTCTGGCHDTCSVVCSGTCETTCTANCANWSS